MTAFAIASYTHYSGVPPMLVPASALGKIQSQMRLTMRRRRNEIKRGHGSSKTFVACGGGVHVLPSAFCRVSEAAINMGDRHCRLTFTKSEQMATGETAPCSGVLRNAALCFSAKWGAYHAAGRAAF